MNTEGQSINAVDGTIGFNPSNIEVVSVSKNNSILNLWVQDPTYSNVAGNINFGGVVLNPGYSGSSGTLITVTLKAKKDGQANVNFITASVLANDGYGTNVLKSMNGASFNITPGAIQQQPLASPKAEAPVVISGFEISSLTHLDQSKWYSNNDPVFQIKFPPDARELNLVLSRNEKSTPKIKYTPPISEKILEDVEEGVWYLHVNYRGKLGLSQTIKYKFQIDTGLPENLKVVRISPDDTINPNPKFELSADDSLSGIDHYEAKIDNGEWLTLSADASGSYSLHSQTPGKKQLAVRAYDQAGNYIESSQELQVDAPPVPIKPAWYLFLGPILETLGKGFDAVLNFMFRQRLPLLALLVVGALVGQLVAKGAPRLSGEIEKIRYIASEYRAQKKLKKLDHKTKLELKILEKDIKKELDLLNKIADHRSLHPEEAYLRTKLDKYYNTLKKL